MIVDEEACTSLPTVLFVPQLFPFRRKNLYHFNITFTSRPLYLSIYTTVAFCFGTVTANRMSVLSRSPLAPARTCSNKSETSIMHGNCTSSLSASNVINFPCIKVSSTHTHIYRRHRVCPTRTHTHTPSTLAQHANHNQSNDFQCGTHVNRYTIYKRIACFVFSAIESLVMHACRRASLAIRPIVPCLGRLFPYR